MILTIGNLPPDITWHDISDFFPNDERISHIAFSDEGDAERLIAWVKFSAVSRVELNLMVYRLNRHYHKQRKLEAYAPLFFI